MVDQIFCSFARSHIAHHNIHVGEGSLHLLQFLNHAFRVPMRRVDDNSIHTCLDQRLRTLQRIGRHAHAGSHTQPPFLVLAGNGFILGFRNIFISNQAHQAVIFIHHGQLFDFILLQDLRSSRQIGGLMRGNKIFMGHHLVNELVHVTFKTQIAIGHDAHQTVVVVDHRNAANVVFVHDGQCIFHALSPANRHGIVNHAVLGTLHNSHFVRLFFNTHVFMNHANAAFTRNSYGHRSLGDGVHRGRHERHIQRDVARERRFQRNLFGQYFRISGN